MLVSATSSRPLREGVDRNVPNISLIRFAAVALYARAWIEIENLKKMTTGSNVALYARAWIEMLSHPVPDPRPLRRPLREGVGRNHGIRVTEKQTQIVALHVRAWVEIA